MFCFASCQAQVSVARLSNFHSVDVQDISAGAQSHDWNLRSRSLQSHPAQRGGSILTQSLALPPN